MNDLFDEVVRRDANHKTVVDVARNDARQYHSLGEWYENGLDVLTSIALGRIAGAQTTLLEKLPTSWRDPAKVRLALDDRFIELCRRYNDRPVISRGRQDTTSPRWTSKWLWAVTRELVRARGHPIPHDKIRVRCQVQGWVQATVDKVYPFLAQSEPGITRQKFHARLKTIMKILFAPEVKDGRTTERKARSDKGKKRKRDEDCESEDSEGQIVEEDQSSGEEVSGPDQEQQAPQSLRQRELRVPVVRHDPAR